MEALFFLSPLAITLSRFALSPFFFIAHQLLLPTLRDTASRDNFSYLLLALLWLFYILIELSDVMDGRVARKHSQVTSIGKVLDPLADIFSKVTYFACFVASGVLPLWMFIIIIYRELIMVGLRMVLATGGFILAARVYGKFKTLLYFVVSGLVLVLYSVMLFFPGHSVIDSARVVVWGAFLGATLVSVFSMVVYIRIMWREGALRNIFSSTQ